MTYFRMGTPTLSSAMTRFTSEFGMGSGGSMSLWPPGNSFWRLAICIPFEFLTLSWLDNLRTLYNHFVIVKFLNMAARKDGWVKTFQSYLEFGSKPALLFVSALQMYCVCVSSVVDIRPSLESTLRYIVKTHGQLVLVSFMHYCTSTPNLSTS